MDGVLTQRLFPSGNPALRRGHCLRIPACNSARVSAAVSEWVMALRAGKLVAACKEARPDRAHGPWRILADNESFLKGRASQREYDKTSMRMWHIPPRSPDLNPVERFWAYLRKRLEALDLRDLLQKRPPVDKAGLRARVRQVVAQQKSKAVAKNLVAGLIKTCRQVRKHKGAAARG